MSIKNYYSFKDHPKYHKVLVTSANLNKKIMASCTFFDKNGIEIENRVIKHPDYLGKGFVLNTTDQHMDIFTPSGIFTYFWDSGKTLFNEAQFIEHKEELESD